MKKNILICLLMINIFLLVGCAKESTQIANPASVYCQEHNGTLEIKNNEQGQYGICHLPNGSECEEWAFFRGECKE